ncbi:hypothetical protein HDU89_006949 [Geranomyces variabilis]|nr:hypothetical protein HDU89_006949 [Geranomyces variabilis]
MTSVMHDNISDCLNRPLSVIDARLTEQPGCSVDELSAHFSTYFSSPDAMDSIPLYTASSSHTFRNGALVRFRCSVQDNSFNPQEYFRYVSLRNSATGATDALPTVFRDTLPEIDGFTALEPDMRRFTPDLVGEKHPVYCVNIPGENDWVRAALAKGRSSNADGEAALADDLAGLNIADQSAQPRALPAKLPVPSSPHAVGALVKTYGADPSFRLNDVIDVVGVIERAPASTETTDEDPMTDVAETAAFAAVPRIHALFYKRLAGPELDNVAGLVSEGDVDMGAWRAEVVSLLTEHLAGDALAAEYLLLHMLSKIDHRSADDTAIGYLPLNISNSPVDPAFSSSLYALLSSILPRTHRLQLTLEHLNTRARIAPAQATADSPTDIGLHAGELQLAPGTLVLIDEAGLRDGTLNERGVRNVQHLATAIRGARLPCLIPYGEISQDIDLRFLVLSQGKCMFGIDCIVPLVPSAQLSSSPPPSLAEVDAALLARARALLATAQHAPYSIPQEMVDVIGADYSAQRAAAPIKGAVDMGDLSRRLEVAKLLCRSLGKRELGREEWEWAGRLEEERRVRVGVKKVHAASSVAAARQVEVAGR